ncbi:RidA family protein [Antarctobacter sp.]|uniref:RidA family protein n=1 Tax=Antarctobacter sp. TaxID=1872577 RepID=UPI003A8DFCDD
MTDDAPIPQGDYVPATRHGPLVYTAGMTPRHAGVMTCFGPVRVGDETALRAAAQLACANALTAVMSQVHPDEEISGILAMTVYVWAEDGFENHSGVADFASAHLRERLGDRGRCSRAAIGVASLPGRAPVEIQLVAAIGHRVDAPQDDRITSPA